MWMKNLSLLPLLPISSDQFFNNKLILFYFFLKYQRKDYLGKMKTYIPQVDGEEISFIVLTFLYVSFGIELKKYQTKISCHVQIF